MPKKKTDEEKYQDKVRNRESYKRFKKLYDIMLTESVDNRIWAMYNLLEEYKAFGSQSGADYAKESINLVLKDVYGEVYYQPEMNSAGRIIGHKTAMIPSFCVWHSKEMLLRDYPKCKPIQYKGNDIENPTFMD